MPRIRAFDSLKEPSFRFYMVSRLCDSSGMNMRQIIQALLLYRLTGSAALLGVLALAQSIPLFVLSPFAGAIADRFQKKYIIMLCGATSTILALAVAISITCGYLSSENAGSWWVLLASSAFDGAIMGIGGPSRMVIIPELVGRERITNAVSLAQMTQNMAQIMAPALAGFLIDGFSFEVAYYTRAALFLVGVGLFSFVPKTSKGPVIHTSILSDIKGGLAYLRQETLISALLVFVLVVVFCSMPYQSLLPIFSEDILRVGASGLGILQSVTGAGAIAGALVLASLPNKKRGMMMLVNGITMGLALLIFSFSKSWVLSLAVVVVIGVGQTGRMTLPMTLLQDYTKPEFRGRVISFYGMEAGLSTFGAFFAALLVGTIGVEWAVGGLALILITLSILAILFMPRLRRMD
jgi:MFS family permease